MNGRIRIVRHASGGGTETRFDVRQRPLQPLTRWGAFAAATLAGIALAALLLPRLPAHPLAWALSVSIGLALFVAALASVAGALVALPHAVAKRARVAFAVRPLGLSVTRPARRSTPRTMHRDEIAGPFVRVDEAIDAEASATTMLRMGGEEMATALAEGARATGGSADTLLWFLFSGCAGSVTLIHRGATVVLAEALAHDEAEELAHRVEMALREG